MMMFKSIIEFILYKIKSIAFYYKEKPIIGDLISRLTMRLVYAKKSNYIPNTYVYYLYKDIYGDEWVVYNKLFFPINLIMYRHRFYPEEKVDEQSKVQSN
jgi:hypothetical protein